jgi:gliding motility-associated lipoprotein GldD
MMNIKRILPLMGLALLAVGCGGGDFSPKPMAYLRIDTPQPRYGWLDTLSLPDSIGGGTVALPFGCDINQEAQLALKKNTRHEMWIDLNYPQWGGVVYLTYRRLASAKDLRGQTDTSMRLLERHYQFASGIDEQVFESNDHTVHATKWHLKGRNVASTYQFYATDSVRHFLRGAVMVNHAPNNDSLAPVLDYMHRDIDRLIETLRWQ